VAVGPALLVGTSQAYNSCEKFQASRVNPLGKVPWLFRNVVAVSTTELDVLPQRVDAALDLYAASHQSVATEKPDGQFATAIMLTDRSVASTIASPHGSQP
jgi:hypothetical protein